MENINEYVSAIMEESQKLRMQEVFLWIQKIYPRLTSEIKWHQPMFMDHGTFIIGFSRAKKHLSFTPEKAGITVFSDDIVKAGYEHTKMLAKIKWTDEVNYDLLTRIIDFNIEDKKLCTTFFRK